MAEDIGDPGKAQWLPQTNTIITLAFVTPISQIADYWGRKGPLVIASVVTCIGSIIVSRATNMSSKRFSHPSLQLSVCQVWEHSRTHHSESHAGD